MADPHPKAARPTVLPGLRYGGRSVDGSNTRWEWAAYCAGDAVAPGRRLERTDALRRYVNRVITSAWWKEHFPETTTVTINPTRPNPKRAEGGRPVHCRDRGSIWVPVKMRNELVILHELAHVLQPQMSMDHRGEIIGVAEHGAAWARLYVELAERFGSPGMRDDLVAAFDHFGVQVASWDGTIELICGERAMNEYILEREAERQSQRAEQEVKTFDTVDKLPPVKWGFLFELLFYRWRPVGRRRSRAALAEAISPAIPTKPTDIAKLMQCSTVPMDRVNLRQAVAALVMMNVDPIELGSRYGVCLLAGSSFHRKLRALNPEWFDEVRRMRALERRLPPYRLRAAA